MALKLLCINKISIMKKRGWLSSTGLASLFFLLPVNSALSAPGSTPVTDTTVIFPLVGDNGGLAFPDNLGNIGYSGLQFGANAITVTNQSTLTGGNGSNAGSIVFEPDSLSGGEGGAGVLTPENGSSSGTFPVLINSISGLIIGGTGGTGTTSSSPGAGGAGGIGVRASSSYFSFANYGIVLGGQGGTSDFGGIGGNGIFLLGLNSLLDNYGIITGGTGGNGTFSSGSGGDGISGNGTFNNYGTINSGIGGTIPSSGGVGGATSISGILNNSGTINGRVFGSTGGFVLNNTGIINGNLIGSGGNDTINQNSGIITASLIALGTGNNTVNINGGTMSGNMTALSGNDNFNMTGGTYSGGVNLFSGLNSFNISGGTITGNLIAGSGNDNFLLDGGIINGNIILGNGNNVFTFSGGTLNGALTFGFGNDTLFLENGAIPSLINLNTGTDTVSVIGDFVFPSFSDIVGAETYRIESNGSLGFSTNHNLFGAGMLVNSGGRLNVTSGNLTNVGILGNQGIVFIGAGRNISANIFTLPNTGTYIFEVASATNRGTIFFTNQIGLGGTTIAVQTSPNTTLVDQDEILIASGSGALFGLNNAPGQPLTGVMDNSFFWDFSIADGSQPEITTSADSSSLFLLVNQANTLRSSSNTPNNQSLITILEPLLANTSNPEMLLIQGRLNTAGSANDVNELLASLLPKVDRSNITLNNLIAKSVSSQISGRSELRLAPESTARNQLLVTSAFAPRISNYNKENPYIDTTPLRDAIQQLAVGVESGMVALPYNQGLWVKGFGSSLNQDESAGIAGYDATIYGITIGADQKITTSSTLGLAISFAGGKADGDGVNNARTNLQTYQASLYGENLLLEDIFLNGAISYAWSDVNSLRSNVGGPSLTSRADYSTQNFGINISVAKPYAVDDRSMVTITGLTNYAYFDNYDYTEYDAGGLNLEVKSDSQKVLELGLDIELKSTIPFSDNSKLLPLFAVGYRYDLIGDTVATSANFSAGGASFLSRGADPGRGTGNIRIGVNYITAQNWDIGTLYDYEYRSDYDAHSAQITGRWKF